MKEENKLPFEIEIEILKYLSPKEIKSLSLANKDWSQVTQSNETWNILHQTRFKDVLSYEHNEAKASYIREHLKSIYCTAKRLVIAWGDNPQYWEMITNEPCESGEIARLNIVFWFDVLSSFPHVLKGNYQPDLYREYPFSFKDGGEWQIVHLPAIDVENDSLVKLQLLDHSGTAKRGLDIDYFALAKTHSDVVAPLASNSQSAMTIIKNLKERIMKYSQF